MTVSAGLIAFLADVDLQRFHTAALERKVVVGEQGVESVHSGEA